MVKYLKFHFYLPLFFLYLFLLISFYPTLFIIKTALLLIFISSLATIFFFIRENLKTEWTEIPEFVLFTLNFFLFILFINQLFFRYIFLIIFLVTSGLFLFFLYRKKFSPRLYSPGSLENISDFIQGFIIFTSLVNLNFARLFYNFNIIFILISIFLLFSWLFFYSPRSPDLCRDPDFPRPLSGLRFWSEGRGLNFLRGLVLTEIYLSLYFLPLKVYFSSLMLLIFYYIIIYPWFGKQKNLELKI